MRPGSTRSGEKARLKSVPTRRPERLEQRHQPLARRARDTSSTRARSAGRAGAPARATSPRRRAAPRSGSRFSVSGVGTQMMHRVGLGQRLRSDRSPGSSPAPPAGGRTGCPRCTSRRRRQRRPSRIDVQRDDVVARLGERDRQRQPDVSEPYNPYFHVSSSLRSRRLVREQDSGAGAVARVRQPPSLTTTVGTTSFFAPGRGTILLGPC